MMLDKEIERREKERELKQKQYEDNELHTARRYVTYAWLPTMILFYIYLESGGSEELPEIASNIIYWSLFVLVMFTLSNIEMAYRINKRTKTEKDI